MSRPAVYWYADGPSQAAIQERPCVILFGGYAGYANFGDILQLKGAISWHQRVTQLRPVILCDAAAITDSGFPDRVRRQFGAAAVVFWSNGPFDFSELGLASVNDSLTIAHLHVYGGGFLNRYWGARSIELIESVFEQFGVQHYVLSGQQVDPQVAPELQQHFRKYPPIIAGGRDPESVRVLGEQGIQAADSFDDATEALVALAEQSLACAREPTGENGIIHLNLSHYTRAGHFLDRLKDLSSKLDRFLDALRGRSKDAAPTVTLVNAYSDRRTDQIVDTLGVVSQLEDSFPLVEFRVVNLVRPALELWSGRVEGVGSLRGAIALASSYHVTLLCGVLGVPCFLQSDNPYYQQKRQGIPGLDADFESFLADPKPLDLKARFESRQVWLATLGSVYGQPSHYGRKHSQSGPVSDASGSPPFVVKPWAGESLARQTQETRQLAEAWSEQNEFINTQKARLDELQKQCDTLWNDLQQLGKGYEQQGEYIKELELSGKQLSSDLSRLRQEHEHLLAGSEELRQLSNRQKERICELEQERDRIWDEAQRLAKAWQTQKDYIHQVEQQYRFAKDALARIEAHRLFRAMCRIGLISPTQRNSSESES